MSKLEERIDEEPLVDALTTLSAEADRSMEFASQEAALVVATKPNGWRCLRQELVTGLPLLVADCLAVCGSVLLAAALVDWILPGSQYQSLSLARQLMAMIGLTILVFSAFGLYPGTGINSIVEFRSCVTAVTLVFTSLMLGNAIFGRLVPYESWLFVIGLLVALVNVNVFRGVTRSLCLRYSWWGQPLLVIGDGESAIAMLETLEQHPRTGLRPIGIVGDLHTHWDEATSRPEAFLGPLSDLASISERHRVYWAAVMADQMTERLLHATTTRIPNLIVVSNMDGMPSLWNRTHDYGGQSALHHQERLLLPIPQLVKRTMDLILIMLSGVFLVPLVTLIAVAIKATSPGPILYVQRRIGKQGKIFGMWKFRSMVQDADQVLEHYLREHPDLLAEWERDHKLRNDPRVTWIGRILRKTSLDELPQLWNVLCGEMSLVGPRPIVEGDEGRPYLLDHPDDFRRYTLVLPGLTGMWQISGRNHTTYQERVRLDAYYVRNWSPWLDAYILAKTIKVVVLLEGAY